MLPVPIRSLSPGTPFHYRKGRRPYGYYLGEMPGELFAACSRAKDVARCQALLEKAQPFFQAREDAFRASNSVGELEKLFGFESPFLESGRAYAEFAQIGWYVRDVDTPVYVTETDARMIRVPVPFCPNKWVYIRCWSGLLNGQERTVGCGSLSIVAAQNEAWVRCYGVPPFFAKTSSIAEGQTAIDHHLMACGGEVVSDEEWEKRPDNRPTFTLSDGSKETYQAWKREFDTVKRDNCK